MATPKDKLKQAVAKVRPLTKIKQGGLENMRRIQEAAKRVSREVKGG